MFLVGPQPSGCLPTASALAARVRGLSMRTLAVARLIHFARQSFRTRVTAFFSHGTFHKQYRERDRKGQRGHHPKGVEAGDMALTS